ncbi:protein FAM32A-like [Melia azedarach]|uniref:Protein FAM32A-like n=1 Tax=Melia azedarach TaxID=155640 RepID=A0ACC1X8K8_MELAZ|nr:protein FAM32A-like [Melia azedarach]
MSEYENVVRGKLKLKGKTLNEKSSGISKKKKHKIRNNSLMGGNTLATDIIETENDAAVREQAAATADDYLTPAERRYLERWEQIDRQRLVKMASKSHRDRIQEFNQYLANLTEHYDIPKVGPG